MFKSSTVLILCILLPAVISLHDLLDCTKSKFGCCTDGNPRSPDADGEKKKGCGVKLCQDFPPEDDPGYCQIAKQKGKCQIGAYQVRNKMLHHCTATCDLCKHAAPPECESSPFGCCWDGTSSSRGPSKIPGKDCPRCHDKLKILCKKLTRDCTHNSFPTMRGFLRKTCQYTCRICRN